jgi:hypothetical protein
MIERRFIHECPLHKKIVTTVPDVVKEKILFSGAVDSTEFRAVIVM